MLTDGLADSQEEANAIFFKFRCEIIKANG
jgi:hypothetical protein